MIDGIKVKLGESFYIIPPLNFKHSKLCRKEINALNQEDKELVALEGTCIYLYHALLRNYPDITLDQVEDWVDFSNFNELLLCIMDVGGLKRKEQQAGEAKPRK